MNRRDLLALTGGGALIGLSGCLGTVQPPDSNESEDEDEPDELEYPSHPDELTSQSVRDYIAEYEEVHHHKSLQRYDWVTAKCDTDQVVINYETDHGIYVSVFECRVSFGSGGNGGNGTGQGTSAPTLYLITEDDLTRIEPEKEEYDDPYLSEDQKGGYTNGVWFSNFDDQHHHLTLRIDHQSNTIFEESFDLEPDSGHHLSNVIGITDEYEFYTELENGPVERKKLKAPNDRSPRLPMAGIIVTPDGTLLVNDIEFNGLYA